MSVVWDCGTVRVGNCIGMVDCDGCNLQYMQGACALCINCSGVAYIVIRWSWHAQVVVLLAVGGRHAIVHAHHHCGPQCGVTKRKTEARDDIANSPFRLCMYRYAVHGSACSTCRLDQCGQD
jgi:hypothetical protein